MKALECCDERLQARFAPGWLRKRSSSSSSSGLPNSVP